MLNFKVELSMYWTGVTVHEYPPNRIVELGVNPEPCSVIVVSSEPIGTSVGSIDVNIGAGASTVSVTATVAGVPEAGARITDPLYIPGLRLAVFTEILSHVP